MADKQLLDLSMIHVDIDDNRIIMTAEDHEQAVRFLSGLIAMFQMVAGEDHVMSAEEDSTPN